MRKLLFISILFAIIGCHKTNKKPAKPDNKPTILTYGLQDSSRQQAEMVVAAQYGFKFKAVAGCVVSNAIADSVATENRITERIITQKFGKDWRFRFRASVDSLRKK